MQDKIFTSWISEKVNRDIQKLDPLIFSKLKIYMENLKTLKAQSEKKDSFSLVILEKEISNISNLMDDLIKVRRKKLVNKILFGNPIDTNRLTNEEFQLNNQLKELLNQNILSSKESYSPKETSSQDVSSNGDFSPLKLIRIKKDISASMGSDLNRYGPFKKEDIVYFPSENARIKIKNDEAKEIVVINKSEN